MLENSHKPHYTTTDNITIIEKGRQTHHWQIEFRKWQQKQRVMWNFIMAVWVQ